MRIFMLVTLGLMISVQCCAFQLSEHSTITRQAISELVRCFPKIQILLDQEWLISANLDEDLNLINKELFYSHFYNPTKHLAMRRQSSAERLTGLLTDLKISTTNSIDPSELTSLGHTIHHLQDMAVPAHVVPVNHWMFDGFESYSTAGDISSGIHCETMPDLREEPSSILTATALTTLENIKNARFELYGPSMGSKALLVSGSSFWIQDQGDDFGEYGYLGNNFGANEFTIEESHYEIPDAYYQEFKQKQLKLAVQATLKALLWDLDSQLSQELYRCSF
jgi:hypothetical protein